MESLVLTKLVDDMDIKKLVDANEVNKKTTKQEKVVTTEEVEEEELEKVVDENDKEQDN